jgi:hypothetical protein
MTPFPWFRLPWLNKYHYLTDLNGRMSKKKSPPCQGRLRSARESWSRQMANLEPEQPLISKQAAEQARLEVNNSGSVIQWANVNPPHGVALLTGADPNHPLGWSVGGLIPPEWIANWGLTLETGGRGLEVNAAAWRSLKNHGAPRVTMGMEPLVGGLTNGDGQSRSADLHAAMNHHCLRSRR